MTPSQESVALGPLITSMFLSYLPSLALSFLSFFFLCSFPCLPLSLLPLPLYFSGSHVPKSQGDLETVMQSWAVSFLPLPVCEHHTWFVCCWDQTQGFMSAREALYQLGLNPASISWTSDWFPFMCSQTQYFPVCSVISHMGENLPAQSLWGEEALRLHGLHPHSPSHSMWWTQNNLDPGEPAFSDSQHKCLNLSETSRTSLQIIMSFR